VNLPGRREEAPGAWNRETAGKGYSVQLYARIERFVHHRAARRNGTSNTYILQLNEPPVMHLRPELFATQRLLDPDIELSLLEEANLWEIKTSKT
jgi:hypothetical protein